MLLHARILGIGAALALTACASAPPRPGLYAELGGGEGIQAIVDGFLGHVAEDARINHFFAGTDVMRLREKLAEQICVEAGGPCTYTGVAMDVIHAGRGIDAAAFNAVVEDLVAAMDDQGVSVSAQNRLLRQLPPLREDIIHR
ncbi:group I truncated hemoglobin [Coralloluteibacterium stylophorae]|uniref:Group 1 truncated hemoglobin n=2 Tax=Coralloluteibacterium stylophorae TaxID=1776034 RepID=A0AAP2CB73_9GAMM|nr:group 1 truncated hemoglobin [Coralloluteibacterium stylophorae]MBS7457603.1 group 1 truncated hemoglobin [Coralloluteibacterium stylophorae]